MTLAKLLEETKEGGELLASAREDARPKCIAAIRSLESALVEALGGEALKGLPRIASGSRFYAAHVRNRDPNRKLDERPVLVLPPSGRLSMAWDDGEGVALRPALDEELLAEDLDAITKLCHEALAWHLQQIEKTTARYEGLSALAAKLEGALLP